MRSLNTYYKKNYKSTDATNFGGGRLLPEDYTRNPLILFVLVLT